MKFAANCMLTTADGPVQMALADFVPRQFSYSGQGLECEISRMGTKGRLTVEISKGGHTVSRASVAGGEGTLRIAVR